MVPDSDKKVSHLIKITEQTPVSWNKSGVWDQVHEQIQPRTSRRWYYYAAAVLILGFLYAYVAPLERGGPVSSGDVGQNQTATQTPPQIMPRDQAADGKGKSSKTKPPILQRLDSPKKQSPLARHVSESTPKVSKPEEDSISIALEMLPILPPDYKVEEQPEIAVREEKIQAIVGVIYENEREEPVTKRKRGKRFYKLSPPDFRIRDEHAIATVVIARKK